MVKQTCCGVLQPAPAALRLDDHRRLLLGDAAVDEALTHVLPLTQLPENTEIKVQPSKRPSSGYTHSLSTATLANSLVSVLPISVLLVSGESNSWWSVCCRAIDFLVARS